MARYTQGTRGKEAGGEGWSGLKNVVYGASEAPRVHGLTSARHLKTPRFKNHYIVRFQYSEELKPFLYSRDQKELIDVTHRVRAIDAPRFDIDTETLNQYNKPRIVPLKITYQPITMTFWDDRSDISNKFWKSTYEFYFLNGRDRYNSGMYSVKDSDMIYHKLGITDTLGYDNYGYSLRGKIDKKNLFQYISLYLIQNAAATRIDLINPYIQSMQHDQFSQDMSSELAQNTVTWGYENVVYYDQRPLVTVEAHHGQETISSDQDLLGILKGDASIFNWQDTAYWAKEDKPFGAQFETVRKVAIKGRAEKGDTGPPGRNYSKEGQPTADAESFAELRQIAENAVLRKRDNFASTEANAEFLKSAGIPKSSIDRTFYDELRAMASNATDLHGLTDAAILAAPAEFDEESFGDDEGYEVPFTTDGNALDTTASRSKLDKAEADRLVAKMKAGEGQLANTVYNANTRIVVTSNGRAQSPTWARAVAEANAQTPAQNKAHAVRIALKDEKNKADRGN